MFQIVFVMKKNLEDVITGSNVCSSVASLSSSVIAYNCFLSQRTVNEWNRLSADCVGASSVNMFKNKIDIYLRRAGYI